MTGITITRLDDTETIKNAFEVNGPLIERIVAVCQGPNEANKWVDLLTTHSGGTRRMTGIDMNRNVSGSSSAVNIQQPPAHVSRVSKLLGLDFILVFNIVKKEYLNILSTNRNKK